MHPVARVVRIFRYPVKSMAAEPLDSAVLGWHGLEGDRRYAFRRLGNASGFPWLTAGRLPGLVRYRPYFSGAGSGASGLRVATPDGDDLELAAPELRARLAAEHGADVELMHLQQGIYDEAAVSLIGVHSVAALEREAGTALDPRRFRPNLLVEALDGAPFAEDAWVGRTLVFGESPEGAAVAVTQRDPRCAMVNLDPETGAADPRVLRAVVRARENDAGVYGVVVRTGPIRTGDPVFLSPPAAAD